MINKKNKIIKKNKFYFLTVNKMENISPELNYSPVVNNHSSIVYRNVSPQAGGNVNLSNGSSVGPTEFLIPPSCWIPNLTKLSFDIQIPGLLDNPTFLNANLLTLIDRITVYDTATSNLIMDCSNFHKYASMVVPAATKIDDFLTKPALLSTGVTPVNLAGSAAQPFEDIQRNLQTTNLNPIPTDMVTFSNTGRRQFLIGVDGAAAAANVYVSVNIPFSALKMSAMSSDKIWYSPSSLVVQIYWSSTTQFAFTADAVATPQTTAAAITTQCVIVSPRLYLANEGNLAIVSQVINKVMSGGGIQLPIAYPTVVQTTTSANVSVTNTSFQYQLTRGYGNRILALVTSIFSAAGVQQNNYHPRYVTNQYNTSLNNVAILTPSGFVGALSTAQSTDYHIGNERYLNGSVIQNSYEYANGEWVHIDGFFGNKRLADVDQHQVDGLDVTAQASTWQFSGDITGVATGYRIFTAIIGQKTMSLTAQGVLVQ
jgi:hypothetical protein